MALADRPMVIGLTGPFGSGCSTAAAKLRHEREFEHIRLSSEIRKRWQATQQGNPSRTELQRLGDQMRRTEGNDVLVRLAVDDGFAPKSPRIRSTRQRRGGELVALTSKQIQKNGQVGLPIEDRRALGLNIGDTVYVGIRDDVLPGIVLVIPEALLEQMIGDGLRRRVTPARNATTRKRR